MIRTFIQARMSSRRFPGKVLAPFRGRPLIDQVVERVARGTAPDLVVVATSDRASDDPLAAHLAARGVAVFRGDLDDVVARFQACLRAFPCEWFFRISADSPLLDGALLPRLMEQVTPDLDLVTNVFPRTFPKGRSVELVRSRTFAALDRASLTAEQREHATKVYYDHPERYRIANVAATDPSLAGLELCVDTLEDLRRLEAASDL